MKKELKKNSRGEAQLSIWYDVQIVEKIWNDYYKYCEQASKRGDLKQSFKVWFYNTFLKK